MFDPTDSTDALDGLCDPKLKLIVRFRLLPCDHYGALRVLARTVWTAVLPNAT